MSANSLRKIGDAGRPVQDEWGLFDPQQAGLPALVRTLSDEPRAFVATSAESVAPDTDTVHAAHCPFCTETLPPGARRCPLCLREINAGSSAQTDKAAVELDLSAKTHQGAVYTLESPARCPECGEEITTIRVLRVLRTQVSFTSTLPRKGYVIICPECERMLSAELSGLI